MAKNRNCGKNADKNLNLDKNGSRLNSRSLYFGIRKTMLSSASRSFFVDLVIVVVLFGLVVVVVVVVGVVVVVVVVIGRVVLTVA